MCHCHERGAAAACEFDDALVVATAKGVSDGDGLGVGEGVGVGVGVGVAATEATDVALACAGCAVAVCEQAAREAMMSTLAKILVETSGALLRSLSVTEGRRSVKELPASVS